MADKDPYIYRIKQITKVVDGDTIDADIDLGFDVVLRDQRVRLYGINTPESRTRDLEEKAKGLAAKARVNEMAPVGTVVTLLTHKYDAKGKFGRILGAIVTDDGTVVVGYGEAANNGTHSIKYARYVNGGWEIETINDNKESYLKKG